MKIEDFWKLISNTKPKEPLTEADFEKMGLLEIWKMFDEMEAESKTAPMEITYFETDVKDIQETEAEG